ncbi:MAG: saccharopine dehydrogenase C-terminal domain-containing protein [Burkholderiaceae bacterium]
MSNKNLPALPAFKGRLVLVGFGAIGQATLPLLLGAGGLQAAQITVIEPQASACAVARRADVQVVAEGITAANLHALLAPRLGAGDVLLNLSVDVSSLALVQWCQPRDVLYLDTCIEPWAGGFLSPGRDASARSNFALRTAVLAERRPDTPTAVLTHGANPGLVSHLLKQALLNLAADEGLGTAEPATREDWARLAQRLDVRVIHIAERDLQVGAQRKAVGEFVNTWSSEAFVDEATQPAELGWGTHERHFPRDGARHPGHPDAPAIYLQRPGGGTRVRSWTPTGGPMHGFLVTHAEAISMAAYLTLGDPAAPQYRPTVHYAYHPCDDAVVSLHELAARQWHLQPRQRLLRDDITEGIDELGVLLMGPARGAYWFGSQLSCAEARTLAPSNSATTLQVAAAVLGGLAWTMRHPRAGIIEPEEMDFRDVLAVARPFLGPLTGVYTDWTPLAGRGWLFEESIDRSDPWQFTNFRVE